MTDLEINIAIAEACGWTCDKDTWTSPEGGRWARRVPGREISDEQILPNYCHDLNAMHEVWSGLSETEKAVFVDELYAVTPSASYEDRYIGATARQRAEAFLRTIGKWKP